MIIGPIDLERQDLPRTERAMRQMWPYVQMKWTLDVAWHRPCNGISDKQTAPPSLWISWQVGGCQPQFMYVCRTEWNCKTSGNSNTWSELVPIIATHSDQDESHLFPLYAPMKTCVEGRSPMPQMKGRAVHMAIEAACQCIDMYDACPCP